MIPFTVVIFFLLSLKVSHRLKFFFKFISLPKIIIINLWNLIFHELIYFTVKRWS